MPAQAKLELETVDSEGPKSASELKPILEALIYVAAEPVSESTLIGILGKEHQESIREALRQLIEQYQAPASGLEIKEVANGYKMATKPEHHEWIRKLIKHQTPPTKLSLAALETLAVIAYKQPITVPEIQEIRGVNAVSVLKTLLDKKLITTSGRKEVIGRPILYRTSREFMVHFGLKNLDELPSLEEFEELARSAVGGVTDSDSLELARPAAGPSKDPAISSIQDRETAQDTWSFESSANFNADAASVGRTSPVESDINSHADVKPSFPESVADTPVEESAGLKQSSMPEDSVAEEPSGIGGDENQVDKSE